MGKGRITLQVLRHVSACNNIKAFIAAGKGEYFHKTGEQRTDYHMDFYEVTKFKIDPMGSDTHRLYSIDGEPSQFQPLTVSMEHGALKMLSL